MPLPSIISGHAPGHLADRFRELIYDRPAWASAEFHRLTGRLWNCTDILPGDVCDEIDLPRGATYAQAVRGLRRFTERA